MNAILWPHIVAGLSAILLGVVAITARKGGSLHSSAGTWFVGFMLFVGATAAILEIFYNDQTGAGGLMTCYFVATSWMTARRRDGRARQFEKYASGVILVIAAYFIGCGLMAMRAGDGLFGGHGANFYFMFGSLCLVAGAMDISFVFRGILSNKQRLLRHLWRMCFGFFFATTSFFLGQRDAMPLSVQDSPILFVLAFAPLVAMSFWIVRIRFAKSITRSKPSGHLSIGAQASAHV